MEQLNIRSNKRAKLNMDQSTTVNYSNMNNNENEFDMKTAKSNKSYTKLIPGTKDKIEEEGYNTEKIASKINRHNILNLFTLRGLSKRLRKE